MLLELRNQKAVFEFMINKVIVGVCRRSSHEQRTTYEDYLDTTVPRGSGYRHAVNQHRLWWEKQEGNLFSEWAYSGGHDRNARVLGVAAASIVHYYHKEKIFVPRIEDPRQGSLAELLSSADRFGLTYPQHLLAYYEQLLNGHNYKGSAAYISVGWDRVGNLNVEEFMPELNRKGLIRYMTPDIQLPVVQGLCAYGLGVAQNEMYYHSSTPSA